MRPHRDDLPTGAAGRPLAPRQLGHRELTVLLAMCMALTALGIDVMLPAFADIRTDLGLPPGSPATERLVTAYFLGMALGQLAFGPLADRFGRKRALQVGFGVYAVAALASALAPTLLALTLARFAWGIGAAGPRVAALAVVRDTYDGEAMARAMSLIMAVFILVPVVAPTFGAIGIATVGWRGVFVACLVAVAAVAVWSSRLAETLAPEHRLPLTGVRVARAAKVVVSHRTTAAYTVAMTLLYGAFTSWIASSELILSETFGQRALFPLIFGCLAATMGLAMFINSRVVERIGTRQLAHRVLLAYIVCTAALLTVAIASGGEPPLWLFLAAMLPTITAHALLIPNFNTIAMVPMGAVAGTAAAVIGAVQVAGGALIGSVISSAYDGTIRPLATGFFGFGLVAVAIVVWAERGTLFRPLIARRDPATTEAPPEVA